MMQLAPLPPQIPECAICFEEFSNKYKPSEREPRLLKLCGHAFCEQCIEALLANNRVSAPCPLCRQDFTRENVIQAVFVDGLVKSVKKYRKELELLPNALFAGDLKALQKAKALGVNLHQLDAHGRTALHLAVQGTLNSNVVRQLIDDGVDPHTRDNEGYTVLHLLCYRLDIIKNATDAVAIVKQLIAIPGIQLNTRNKWNATPISDISLHTRDNTWSLPVLKLFLESGADPNTYMINSMQMVRGALMNACYYSNIPAIEMLLDFKANPLVCVSQEELASHQVSWKFRHGPLAYACRDLNFPVLACFLSAGYKIEGENKQFLENDAKRNHCYDEVLKLEHRFH